MNLYEEGGFTVWFIKLILLIKIKKIAAKNRIADVDAIEAGGVSSDREYKVLWKWINQKYTKKLQDIDLEVILDKQYHEKITELAKEYEGTCSNNFPLEFCVKNTIPTSSSHTQRSAEQAN